MNSLSGKVVAPGKRSLPSRHFSMGCFRERIKMVLGYENSIFGICKPIFLQNHYIWESADNRHETHIIVSISPCFLL
ncbi:MAG: hypothetical protein AAB544_05585, partial [Patescibacteria group bacterium]